MIMVRPAVAGDGPFLLVTTRELGSSHGWGTAMTATAQKLEDALFCADPIVGALIAEVEGKPAGSALWHRSFSTSRGEEAMYLEDLVVLPEFRRMGVADVLMKSVAKLAVSRGYSEIFWLVMGWNTGAQVLYSKLGAQIEDGNCYCSLHDQALLDLAR